MPGFNPARRLSKALLALALLGTVPALAEAQTLERIHGAGKIVLGYEADARPFSFESDGKPDGFAVALCNSVAEVVKGKLNQPSLNVEWIAVPAQNRLAAVRSGQVDLLCGASSITLADSASVSFSLPIFPGGTGAVLRADALTALKAVLTDESLPARPIWRGTPARTFLDKKTFAVVAGTASEAWLTERIKTLQLASAIAPVATIDEGMQQVAGGGAAAFFGPLPILLDAWARSSDSGALAVLPRQLTYEPIGLAMTRGDEDFRLAVNTALSHAYRDAGFRVLFTQWFGMPDAAMENFFRQTVLPD